MAEVSDAKPLSLSEKPHVYLLHKDPQLSVAARILYFARQSLGTGLRRPGKGGNGYAPGSFVVSSCESKILNVPLTTRVTFSCRLSAVVPSEVFPCLSMIQQRKVNLTRRHFSADPEVATR